MKLLLDEHYPKEIAIQLRRAGYDVTTVSDSGRKRTRDEALLQIAAAEERVLVSNNARDFQPIARQWLASGRSHFGILLTSDRSLPRHRRYAGLYVRALRPLLDTSADDALFNQIRWLSPPPA